MKCDSQFRKMFYFQNLLAQKIKCIVWQRTFGEQGPDFQNVKYFARTNFAKAICLATTNTTTEILHKPARYLLFVSNICSSRMPKGKMTFFAFFLSSCNLSLVSWYLGNAVDKLVKIQRRETCTETEKKVYLHHLQSKCIMQF